MPYNNKFNKDILDLFANIFSTVYSNIKINQVPPFQIKSDVDIGTFKLTATPDESSGTVS